MIEVIRAGALTTVQDLGRAGLGFDAMGVPRGGAFDPWAARAANRLVGNADGAALLEITLAGPQLRVERETVGAWVGDDFDATVEGEPFPPNVPRRIPAGATVDVGRARPDGVRAWLAFAGGIDVPVVLGSCSTELASGFGGFGGRALRRGDALSLFPSKKASLVSSVAQNPFPPRRDTDGVERLHVVPGPDERLAAGGAVALAAQRWRVDPRSDRRGVRLAASNADGAALALAPHAPLRSQPMLPGAVELTSAREAIVLGVDAPVTGGYPWIAQTVAADVGRLAHLAPGAEVRFELGGFAAATAALAAREQELERALDEVKR
jgi:biotin-dependent carboxylase-like uncharacterized protein